MARNKKPPKPVQKWFAVTYLFFVPEATSEFLAIPLPAFRAKTEADAVEQATQHITRKWYDIESEQYLMGDDDDPEDKYPMLPWKLVAIEIPELFAKRLESEWQFDKREERKEARMPTSQPATILDFPIRPPVVSGGTPPADAPEKPST